jgi:hypothetical protein
MDCDPGPHIGTMQPAEGRAALAERPHPLPGLGRLPDRPRRRGPAAPAQAATTSGVSVPALSGLASDRVAAAISTSVTFWG